MNLRDGLRVACQRGLDPPNWNDRGTVRWDESGWIVRWDDGTVDELNDDGVTEYGWHVVTLPEGMDDPCSQSETKN